MSEIKLCKKIKEFIIKNHLYISFIILFVYLSPFLIFWDDIPVIIHDNLDSTIIWWKILSNSKMLFADNHAIVPNMMNGLPRLSYGSEIKLNILFFYLFPAIVAYIINEFFIHIFAFIGMYLLLKNHFQIEHKKIVKMSIINGVALTFAFLPFWSPGGLSIAGLPLVLYSFLNIRFNKSTKIDWMILTFIPFYSSLIFSFIFFIVIIFVIFLKDWIFKHNFNKKFFLALLYFGSIYLLIEYRLILSIFDTSYISHRSEFVKYYINFSDSVKKFFGHLIEGQYHSESLHKYILLYSLLILILSSILLKISKREDFKEIKPKIGLLIKMFMLSLLISFIYALSTWNQLSGVYNEFPILKSFQWDRFYTLNPIGWYIILAISLDINILCIEKSNILDKLFLRINKNRNRLNIKIEHFIIPFLTILISFQGMYVIYSNHTHNSLWNSIRNDIDYISYSEFYAEEQFNTIKNDIGLPQEDYRIGCIGFEPAVALYNGFYTIDGYMSNYPLEYKRQFRYLISKELEKNDFFRTYFDGWGSRSYIFVAEIGGNFKAYKWVNEVINNLELNVTALKDLDVSFIFSSLPINNYNENNLTLFNMYNHEDSIWRIFVYEVI